MMSKKMTGHNADESQEPQNGARSLPIEKLSVHSRSKNQKQQNVCDFKNIKCKTNSRFGAKSFERATRTSNPPREAET